MGTVVNRGFEWTFNQFLKNSLFQSNDVPRKKQTGSRLENSKKPVSRMLIGSLIQTQQAS